jgi:hypothetical protein
MKKKKKTAVIRTTQPREKRLHSAKEWMAAYSGKNMVRGYAKKYRVDLLTAITDLRLLGLPITAEYEEAVKRAVEQRIMQNQQMKEVKKNQLNGLQGMQDDDFAYIVGYTSGGAPYGLTWEEMPEEDAKDFNN